MGKKLEAIALNASQADRGAISVDYAKVQGEYWAYRFNHHSGVKRIRQELGLTPPDKLYAEVFHIHRGFNF